LFTHPHFKTERLLIRPIDKDDAAFVLELMNTPKWIKNIGDRHVNTVKEAETYINERHFLSWKNMAMETMLL